MTTTLTYKNAYENDCDSITSWYHGVSVILVAAGYVDCVAGDIGKYVNRIAGGVCVESYGTLSGYDNATNTWWVLTTLRTTVIIDGIPLGLDTHAADAGAPDGTGAGTSATCISHEVRTFTSDGDVFTMSGTTATNGHIESFYEQLDITNFSSDTYPKLTVRWNTSATVTSPGLQAQVKVIYSDNSTSTHVLGYTSTGAMPTVTTVNLTAAKTVSKIELWAIEDVAANPNGTHYVYYDWFIFHAGTFTFPHVAPGGVDYDSLMKLAQIEIPGREGDINQRLGMKSPTITVTGDVLEGEQWESAATWPNFDYFLVGLKNDTWAYFTCDKPRIRCQVMYKRFRMGMDTSGNEPKLVYSLTFVVHKLNPFSSWYDWHWLYGNQ